jgi:hypothetical protein
MEPKWIHSARRPLIGLLYLPRVIMRLENSVEWLAGETKLLGENLPQCHFAHQKTHLTWPGANSGRRDGKPATNRVCYGTADLPCPCLFFLFLFLWKRGETVDRDSPLVRSARCRTRKFAIWKSCLENSLYMHFHLSLFALIFRYTLYFPFFYINIIMPVTVCLLQLLASFCTASVAMYVATFPVLIFRSDEPWL